jgi:hypothetical protein
MNKVADWQTREGVASSQIVFTEFGAMKQTIDGAEIGRASRARWLRETTAAIESHGWAGPLTCYATIRSAFTSTKATAIPIRT